MYYKYQIKNTDQFSTSFRSKFLLNYCNYFRKESEIHSISGRLEDEQSLVAKLQKQIKEQSSRISELEEELDAERQSRARVRLT